RAGARPIFLAGAIGHIIESVEIECLPNIGGVVASLRKERVVVGRRLRVLRTVRITNAVRPHVLGAQGEALRETAVPNNLQTVVMVAAATRLRIDFSETIRHCSSIGYISAAKTAIALAELTNRDSCPVRGVHDDTRDPVRNAA